MGCWLQFAMQAGSRLRQLLAVAHEGQLSCSVTRTHREREDKFNRVHESEPVTREREAETRRPDAPE